MRPSDDRRLPAAGRARSRQARRRFAGLAAGLVLCGMATPPAGAQTLSTGDLARHAGLGGGGIALADPRASSQVNPAALATSTGVRVPAPRVTLAEQGEKARPILESVLRHHDFDHLLQVGFGLLKNRSQVWIALDQSLRIGHLELGLGGGGEMLGSPNAPTRRWARQGHFGLPPPRARFVAELGYHFDAALAYGRRLRLPGETGSLDAGLRLVPTFGRYQRSSFRAARTGEIDAVHRQDEESLVLGADLGFRYLPADLPALSAGLVVRGLSRAQVGRMRRPGGVDLGAALRLGSRATVVADWTHFGSSDRLPARLGAGAELVVWPRWLALRGAVTTRGLAVGFDLGPLSFAYAADGESLLRTGFSF